MSDPRPIGIFDSGIGGLTVAREIFRLMPSEQVVYIGDTARSPFGGHSDETIIRYALQDLRYLNNIDVKMIVIACNTVSAVALESIEQYKRDIPVIGVVYPGARAAVLRTAEKKVGVIATEATIRTGAYTKAIQNIDPSIKVYGKSCPLLVPIIEEGLVDADVARLMAQHYLYEMTDLSVDCLILGCTHYPLLIETIQGTVGNRMQLLDSALWTAKETQDILTALDALAPKDTDGLSKSKFIVTEKTPRIELSADLFFKAKLPSLQEISVEELIK